MTHGSPSVCARCPNQRSPSGPHSLLGRAAISPSGERLGLHLVRRDSSLTLAPCTRRPGAASEVERRSSTDPGESKGGRGGPLGMVATDTVRPQWMRAPDMFTVDPQVSRLVEYDV